MSFYKYINYLSIDVAIGAVISSAFMGRLLGAEINAIVCLTLGLVTWSIYTFDHLLDAKKGEVLARLPRHNFHLKHFNLLSILLLSALSIVLVLLFFLPIRVILIGTSLGLIVILYFISINFLHWKKVYHKEITVALVYFSGIMVGPLSSPTINLETTKWFFLPGFFILILLNLLIFSMYDQKADISNNFPSIFRVLKKPNTLSLIYVLMILFVFGVVIQLINSTDYLYLITTLMFVVLCLLHFYSYSNFCKNYYRYLGDGIFLIPVIYLI